MVTLRTAWTGLISLLLVAGCASSPPFTVTQSELERQAANQLATSAKIGVTPTITCPTGLKAKVGATLSCLLTEPNNIHSYDALITITAVDNKAKSASFKVDVAPVPNR